MNKKVVRTGIVCGTLVWTTIIAYAITTLFYSNSVRSNLSKKVVFQFDLTTDMAETEVGPGDSFDAKPIIYNDSTEEMYVFIQVDMPVIDDEALYSFDSDSAWTLVESGHGKVVYAYGNPEMAVLIPGDSTTALTEQMTMKSISHAEYAAVDDINVTITGYSIGTEGVSANPTDAWNECKSIGNIQ